MFYHFAIDTHANFDEADYSEPHEGKRSLPTTTHNSPGSDRSIDPHPHSLGHSYSLQQEHSYSLQEEDSF